jgi:YVTN family beta-propeller protein
MTMTRPRIRAVSILAAVLVILGLSALVALPASATVATAQPSISVGASPVGVAFNPTGTKGWIAVNGTSKLESVNRSTGVTAIITLAACSGPMSIVFTPSSPKAYVACYNSNNVVEFSPSNPVTSAKSIPVGTHPFFIAMSPDGTKAYVPNSGGVTGTVSVIDTSTDTVTATIPVGLAPVAVAFNPTSTTAYVASGTNVAGGNVVTMIDVATSTVPVGTVALPNPIALNGVPYGLAVSPNGSSLWVSRDNGKMASIVNTATNTVAKTFVLTGKPEGVTFSPDGRRVYMPVQSGGIAVFDAINQTQLPYLASGTGSRIMAFSSDGKLAYVSNNTDATVSVYSFDTTQPTISGTPTAGSLGTPYSFTPTVTGPDVTVSVLAGSLPPGLLLAAGVVSGTPTAAGSYPVTLRATNDNADVDLTITLSIAPLPTITGTAAADVPLGASFAWTPTITAQAGYLVTSTTLPAGLALNAATGVISGTPTGALGPTTTTLTVTDTAGTTTIDVTLTVTHGVAQALTVTASNTTPNQGDMITLNVLAGDAYGNSWEVTSTAVITSDVATDAIAGNTVTFPHASPHVLTATLGAAKGTVLINVVPASIPLVKVLGLTGGTVAVWLWPWALGVLAAGSALLAVRMRMARTRRQA